MPTLIRGPCERIQPVCQSDQLALPPSGFRAALVSSGQSLHNARSTVSDCSTGSCSRPRAASVGCKAPSLFAQLCTGPLLISMNFRLGMSSYVIVWIPPEPATSCLVIYGHRKITQLAWRLCLAPLSALCTHCQVTTKCLPEWLGSRNPRACRKLLHICAGLVLLLWAEEAEVLGIAPGGRQFVFSLPAK